MWNVDASIQPTNCIFKYIITCSIYQTCILFHPHCNLLVYNTQLEKLERRHSKKNVVFYLTYFYLNNCLQEMRPIANVLIMITRSDHTFKFVYFDCYAINKWKNIPGRLFWGGSEALWGRANR